MRWTRTETSTYLGLLWCTGTMRPAHVQDGVYLAAKVRAVTVVERAKVDVFLTRNVLLQRRGR